ncbi:MAG TPA: hypothetical protein VEW71_01105 [Allosphingosinicella sp.]|nr:hypothetical protein [Allosphingosinicella sp.]
MPKAPTDRAREPRRIMNRGPNLSIYDSSNYNTEPRCIYFYYLMPRGGNTDNYDVAAYYFDNGPPAISLRDLKQRAVKLVENHRTGGNMAEYLPRGFDEPWRRRSWLLGVLGDPDYAFDRRGALTFVPGGGYASNLAFLDGDDFRVAASNDDRLSAFCCINHMYANEHRDDLLEEQVQPFCLKFHWSKTGFQRPRPPDTGGTNMGPPVPPPV